MAKQNAMVKANDWGQGKIYTLANGLRHGSRDVAPPAESVVGPKQSANQPGGCRPYIARLAIWAVTPCQRILLGAAAKAHWPIFQFAKSGLQK